MVDYFFFLANEMTMTFSMRLQFGAQRRSADHSDSSICWYLSLYFCRHGCAQPVYATFTNGMAYGFAPGRPLTRDDVAKETFGAKVACHMAKFHQIIPAAGEEVEPVVLRNLRTWLERLPEKFTNDIVQSR